MLFHLTKPQSTWACCAMGPVLPQPPPCPSPRDVPILDASCTLAQTVSCSTLTAPSRCRWPRALTAGVLLRLLRVVRQGCLPLMVELLLLSKVCQLLLLVSEVALADVTVNCIP